MLSPTSLKDKGTKASTCNHVNGASKIIIFQSAKTAIKCDVSSSFSCEKQCTSNTKIKVKKKFSRIKKKHVPTLELVDLVDSSQKVVKSKRLNCCP